MVRYRPDLIYLQSSGFGWHGPYRTYKSWGPVAAAVGGITHMGGLPEDFPTGFGNSYMDVQGGWFAAMVLMAALRVRRRTGRGQFIDLAQAGAAIMLNGTALLDYGANGRSFTRLGNRAYGYPSAPHGLYPCAGDSLEGDWIAIDCATEAAWRALRDCMGAPAWTDEPRFATLEARGANRETLDGLLAEWTRGQDKYALMDRLQAAGVPAGPVQPPADRVERDPQLAHRRFFVDLPHTAMGRVRTERPAGLMSASPPHVGGLPNRGTPDYAEDSDWFWGEVVGLAAGEIERLRANEVI
jgi:crotonobetainyl-CoA:carnitine CoA-transferase CaiB-like acyl-CoA transferase